MYTLWHASTYSCECWFRRPSMVLICSSESCTQNSYGVDKLPVIPVMK